MGKRVRIALAVSCIGVVGVMAWGILQEREPVYQGKGLTEWLSEADKKNPLNSNPNYFFRGYPLELEAEPAAAQAIKAMGTNALPPLMRMMEAEDSPLWLKLMALVQRQSLIRIHYVEAVDLHAQAVFGLRALGSNANSAVPELMALYSKRQNQLNDQSTASALVNISPESFRACSLALANNGVLLTNRLARLALFTQVFDRVMKEQGNPELALRAAKDAEILRPWLMRYLDDPDFQIRTMDAWLLSMLGGWERGGR